MVSEATSHRHALDRGNTSGYPAPAGNPSVVVNLGAAVGVALFRDSPGG